jgi:hypothetical protein
MADQALVNMSKRFDATYAKTGRPSIPPEKSLRRIARPQRASRAMATMECTAERERAGSSLGATDEFTAANRFGAARALVGLHQD